MSDLSTICRLLDAIQTDLQADEFGYTLRKAHHALENAQADLDEQARRFPAHIFKRNGRLLVLRDAATPPELLAAHEARQRAERTLAHLQQGTRLRETPHPANCPQTAEEIATRSIERERRRAAARGNIYLSGD